MRETALNERRTGKLGDLLPIRYGKSLSAKVRDPTGDVPVYGSSGRVGVHSAALTKGPALIVGRKGSVGSVYFSEQPCWPIDTAYFTEAVEGQNLRYFKYLLDSLNLVRLDKSTAIPGLSRDDYNALEVTIASPDEQHQIVAEIEKQFSRLDDAVTNLKRVKANLKRYKAAVLKAAVEGRLVPTEAELAQREGRSYETGAQLLQRVLTARRSLSRDQDKHINSALPATDDLQQLPTGWVWGSAVQVCARVVDCHNKTAPYKDAGIPLIRTTNIRDGRLNLEGVRYVDQPTYDFWSRRCPPEPGDVLFTREAPMGEAGIIPPGLKLCLGQRTMLLRQSEAISENFLLIALLSPVIKDLIDRVAVGSGVKHLRVGDVETLPIPVPPKSEQLRIASEVDRQLSIIRVMESELEANLSRAEQLRQSTLAFAFAEEKQ